MCSSLQSIKTPSSQKSSAITVHHASGKWVYIFVRWGAKSLFKVCLNPQTTFSCRWNQCIFSSVHTYLPLLVETLRLHLNSTIGWFSVRWCMVPAFISNKPLPSQLLSLTMKPHANNDCLSSAAFFKFNSFTLNWGLQVNTARQKVCRQLKEFKVCWGE